VLQLEASDPLIENECGGELISFISQIVGKALDISMLKMMLGFCKELAGYRRLIVETSLSMISGSLGGISIADQT
jgi:hypothetical protein